MRKKKTFFIVNPNAAGGSAIRRWPLLSDEIARHLGKFDYDFTNASGVATMLTSDAVDNGYELIVSVGGDGTLNEVLNGLFKDGGLKNPEATLGIIPMGAGSDLPRSLRLSHEPRELIKILKDGETRKFDVGAVTLKGYDGKERMSYFLNMADVGVGGQVAKRADSLPKYMGGFLTFLSTTLVSLVSYSPKMVRIRIDDKKAEERHVTTVFIANGQYFGGGMWIAPKASLDDGLFDVIVVGRLSRLEMVKLVPKLYTGKLSGESNVECFRAKRIKISSEEDIIVNCDGEQPGLTPAEFKVLPQVLKIKCKAA